MLTVRNFEDPEIVLNHMQNPNDVFQLDVVEDESIRQQSQTTETGTYIYTVH